MKTLVESDDGDIKLKEGGLPGVSDILKKGIRQLVKEKGVKTVNELIEELSLEEVIGKVEEKAEKIYMKEERKAVKRILAREDVPAKITEKVTEIFLDKKLATSIANTRRARAGVTSEEILSKTLEATGIPCERGRVMVKGYRPDLVAPSNDVLNRNPKNAVAIAIKRTLRERWAEDTNIFKKFPHGKFVLLTADPDFKESKAKDMVNRGMKEVYIPDKLHKMRRDFVIEYREFKKHSQLPDDISQVIGFRQKRLV